MEVSKFTKKLNIAFTGEMDWRKFRDYLILKLKEADTEEKFNFVFKAVIGSMFTNIKDLESARKAIGQELRPEEKKAVRTKWKKLKGGIK